MVFTKDGLFRLLITIGLSIFICLFIFLIFDNKSVTILDCAKSALVGSGIWLVSEISFSITTRFWPHNILPSYVAMFLLIALGTTAGLILLDIQGIMECLVIITIAEVGGFTIAIINMRRYKKKLNDKLESYKKVN